MLQSEIWVNKPSSWKIIWLYILTNVAHETQGSFVRGRGFFNFSQDKRNIGIDISDDNIKKCLVYLRTRTMISTTRSTRGMYITVLNYNAYQENDKLTSTTESTTPSTREAREKHERSTPIHKNVRMKEVNTNTGASEDLEVDDVEFIPEEPEIRKRKETFELPDWLDKEIWAEWESHRAAIRKKLTVASIKLQIRMLDSNRSDHVAIIENSIKNGWTGLFPIDPKKNPGKKQLGNVWSDKNSTQIQDFIRSKQKQS